MAFLESRALIGLRLGLLHKPFQSGARLLISPVLPHALTLGRRQGFLELLAPYPQGAEPQCGEAETELLDLGMGANAL